MQIFMHRVFAYRPHKPRNPLLRLGLGLLGVALLGLFIVFGLFMILLSDIIAVEEVALGILLGLWGVAAALWTQSLRLRRARR